MALCARLDGYTLSLSGRCGGDVAGEVVVSPSTSEWAGRGRAVSVRVTVGVSRVRVPGCTFPHGRDDGNGRVSMGEWPSAPARFPVGMVSALRAGAIGCAFLHGEAMAMDV